MKSVAQEQCQQLAANHPKDCYVLVAYSPTNMLVYLRDGSAQTIARVTTLIRLTQSLYIDPGPASLSADPITPDGWQGSHLSALGH